MRSNIYLGGTDNVNKKIDAFIKEKNTKAIPIMRTAAEVLCAAARAKAPVSKQGKKKGKWSHPPGTLRSSIQVGIVFRTKNGISAAVGMQKNQYFTQAPKNMWYARFVEFGTVRRTVKHWWGKKYPHDAGVMPASPFMRPAIIQSKTKIKNTVRYRLEEELFSRG